MRHIHYSFCILFLSAFCTSLQAQENTLEEKNKMARVNLNMSLLDRNVVIFNGFTPQLSFRNKEGNWHEVEILQFSFRNEKIKTDWGSSIKYQHTIPMFKQKNFMFQPTVGAAVVAFADYRANRPEIMNLYDTRYFFTSTTLQLVPGVRFKAGRSVFLSLESPVDAGRFVYTYTQVKNPTWTAREQENYAYRFDQISPYVFQLRVGAGVLF